MRFCKTLLTAAFVAALCACSGLAGQSELNDPDHGPLFKGRVVNMLNYLVPKQTVDDPKPFHLTGYSRCFWGECVGRGEPPYSEGGFSKVYRMADNGSGDIRYVAMKTSTKPSEYSVVKEVFEDGKWVTKSFLEDEDMHWGTDGWELRDYHDDSGFPTFEWGRSNAIQGETNIQIIPWCDWRYCGKQADRRELMGGASVYTVQEFVLTGDISKIVAQLGDRAFGEDTASVLQKWLALSAELNLGRPRLMVISGYWSPIYSGVMEADPSLWYQREIYSYLEGVGWVGWWWQNHENHDQQAPFSTLKGGVMTTVVWEDPQDPVLAYDVCAKLPSGYAPSILSRK